MSLLISQILGIVVTVAIVLVLDLVIAAVVKMLFHGSLRVDEADEALGLDVSQHGESAYPSFSGLDSQHGFPRHPTLPLKPSLAYRSTRRSSFGAISGTWKTRVT